VNFDLLWNYRAGGMYFFADSLLKNKAYEVSDSIEIDPVESLGTPAMKTLSLNYSAKGSAENCILETMNF
jgi:hypothetical protein